MKTEQIARELAEIQSRVPASLKKAVVREEYVSPTIRRVVEIALADKNFDPEKKRQLQILKDSGEFDKKRTVEDPKIAKIIDNFVSREINKKIKAGKLPPRSKHGKLEDIKKVYEEIHRKKD